jgi:NHLM bacteriocin system ABC transporter peptidase/ATP-binding protein
MQWKIQTKINTALKTVKELIKRPSQTPTVLQMEALECGAAALAIILAHHGKHVALEEVRSACGVSRDGSKAVNMLRAARKYGLDAEGIQVDDLQSLNELKPPYIIFWEFNHFVVVEEIKTDKIYINDPATGPRTISIDEFNKGFTGVVLKMAPNERFVKGGSPVSISDSIKKRLAHFRDPLSFVIVASLALVIPGIIIPGFTKIFIDEILIRDMHGWILPLLFGMFLTALMRSALSWMQNYYMLRLRIKLMLTNSAQFLWHVLHLPMNFFMQRFAGDINERIGANTRIAVLLSEELSGACVGLISMVFFAIVMLLLSFQLGMIAIAVGVINFILLFLISRKMADMSRRMLQQQGRLAGFSMSSLQAIENMKAMAGEDDFFKRWSGQHAGLINSGHSLAIFNQLLQIFPQLIRGLSAVIILGYGSLLIMQGQITVGTLVALQTLVSSFNGPLNTLLGFGGVIQRIRGDLARLDDVLNYPDEERLITDKPITQFTKKRSTSIDIEQMSFGYSQLEHPFFDDFNMHIKAGSHVAIVGESGSGKSTLAKLIAGLYPCWEGNIQIEGHPVTNLPQSQIAEVLSLVDQDIFLFEGTVKENLTLWKDDVDDEVLYQALDDVLLSDEISQRGNLQTKVREFGGNFSGGQKQRLEIARALINNPAVLILDEATANLDSITEKEIYKKIKARDCTLIIIAHRLSAIRDCDEIFVLDQGKIVQNGKHEALLQEAGLYKNLVRVE